jgi:hypothetical protein
MATVLNLAERHPPLFIIVVADVHQVLQVVSSLSGSLASQ